MAHYTKLWSHILDSTIWHEDDHTRLVWITMLAMSDIGGYVAGSIPGLGHRAHVPVDACIKALDKLKAPDEFSRTKENEGRRIKEVDGGWQIINYDKHREAAAEEIRREQNRERQHRFREKFRNAKSNGVTRDVTQNNAPSPPTALASANAVLGEVSPKTPQRARRGMQGRGKTGGRRVTVADKHAMLDEEARRLRDSR